MPVEIADVNELQAMLLDLTADYLLVNDIDASDTLNWNGGAGFEPIGTQTPSMPFLGTVDGNGYVVCGLHINRPSKSEVGLFGNITGEVFNLGLTEVDIVGGFRTGGFAGRFGTGLISGCYVTGVVVTTDTSSNVRTGGFVGNVLFDGVIENCYSHATVRASGQLAGGFCGRIETAGSTIRNCYSTGMVQAVSGAGGFLANQVSGLIEGCYWDIESSGVGTSVSGIGKTTAEMQRRETYVDWDFHNTWYMQDERAYPTFLIALPNIQVIQNDPPFMRSVYGDAVEGRLVSGAPVVRISLEPDRYEVYKIEVHSLGGRFVQKVSSWFRGSLKQELNEASYLKFSVLSDDPVVELLNPGYTLWVRDRFGFLVDTFILVKASRVRRGDATEYVVEARGRIYQLAKELVLDYRGEWDSETESYKKRKVKEHLDALLAYQVHESPIVLGGIGHEIANYEVRFQVFDVSLLEAIRQLQMVIPRDLRGYLWIDMDGALQWIQDIPVPQQGTLAVGQHIQGLEYTLDWGDFFTRLYLFGEGNDPRTRVSLMDEGAELPEPYLDAASEVIAQYGIVPMFKQDRRVRYGDTLLRMAERLLEEFSKPAVTICVDALDLAKSDTPGYGWKVFDDIWLGAEYRVVDVAQGIEEVVRVLSLEWDMGNPLPVKIELKNRLTTLPDLMRRMYERTIQPFDVNNDGSLYPNVARNYSTEGPLGTKYRAGDTRVLEPEKRLEYFDGEDWQETGGGGDGLEDFEEFVEELFAEENPEPTGVEERPGDSGALSHSNHKHLDVAESVPEVVDVLPSIPKKGMKEVYWTSAGAGNGDDQVWRTYAGQSEWYPTQKLTNLSGNPGVS